MTILHYKDYTATCTLDLESGVIFGRVDDLRDVITFEATAVGDVERMFHEAVDDYLAFCAERGQEPERPFSGRLPFRTTPERHRRIALAARMAGKSINSWMDDALTTAANAAMHSRSSSAARASGVPTSAALAFGMPTSATVAGVGSIPLKDVVIGGFFTASAGENTSQDSGTSEEVRNVRE